jgi:hypothetical protein
MHYSRLSIGVLIALSLALLAGVRPVSAAPPRQDEVILGDDLILTTGEHISGDVLILDGDLTLHTGSRVDGDAVVLAGRAQIDGAVGGDMVALGGDVILEPHAHIQGDVISFGGQVEQAPGAQAANIIQGPALGNVQFWRDLTPPFAFWNRPIRSFTGTMLVGLIGAVGLGLLAAAVITLWPARTARVGETIVRAPLPSLGLGCLLYPLVATFTLLILLTICLAPLAPAAILIVVASSLLGWIALGTLWGRRLLYWLGWHTATPAATAGVGVFVLTGLAVLAGYIPCLGAVIVLGAASIGLGAVALSRLGSTGRERGEVTPPQPHPSKPNS